MIVKNLEKKEHSVAMFQVDIDAEAFRDAVERAYRKEKGKIFVAGFRKGKAPRAVIEGMYGKDVFHEGAVTDIAPRAFEFGAEESGLRTVGMPGIADYTVDDSGVLTVTFTTELYPEVTLGDYKGLEAPAEEASVTDEAVDDEVESARKRNARLVDVKRPVRKGDTIVFDFEGFTDGVPFEGGKSEDYSLEIGSGSFIPGFEDQMVGMELETDGEVNVTFPENYDPKLAGKAAVFKVKVHGVKEPQYPELDDEFAKDVSEFDTLAEYKADLRSKLEAQAKEAADADYHAALMGKAIDNMTAEVPESMITDKCEEFLHSYADSMGLRGRVSREDTLNMLGMTEELFLQMARPNALKQVKGDLLLDKIIEVEALEADQEAKDEFYKKVDEDYGADAEKIKEMIDDKLLCQDLCRKKAAELIYASGIKTAPEAETEKAEDGEKPAAKKTARKPKADAETAAEGPAEKKPAARRKPADGDAAEKPAAKRTVKKVKADAEEKAD